VAHTRGLGGAVWSSDLSFLNPSGEERAVEMEFLPETGRGNGGGTRMTRTLGAGTQRSIMDFMAELGLSGVGGLLIRSDGAGVLLHSRTAAGGENGSYGQSIDAMPTVSRLGEGERAILCGLASGDGFHSNVEVLNLGEDLLEVEFVFHASDATELERRSLHVQARSFAQIADVLGGRGMLRAAWAGILSRSPGADYVAFASVIDDSSHDPTSISPLKLGDLGSRLLLPVAAAGPGFNYSRWSTGLSIANPGFEDAVVEAVFHPADASGDLRRSWDLQAGRSRYFKDLLPELFGIEGLGWVEMSSSTPVASSARIYNTNDRGSYGQEVPALSSSSCGGRRIFSGLRSDGSWRSNLGLTSLDDVDRRIMIRVFGEDGRALGEKILSLPAGAFVQEAEFLKRFFDFRGRAWLEVEAEEPEACFVAHVSSVDGLSGDPTYLSGWRLSREEK